MITLILSAALLSAAPPDPPASLKDAFAGVFRIGAALNEAQFSGRDARAAGIIASQFNTISPENVLKWERVHPKPGVYDFAATDRYVAFGEEHKMWIIGHTLVWHSQTPLWVFQDDTGKPLTREVLLDRLREHIRTVVGRYKGRINGWDVVNEALNEDGTMRQSPWLKIIGEDYIAEAFRFAREADPKAELYYNDYNIENPAKRAGCLRLLQGLQKEGIRVDAVGMQGHYRLEGPSIDDQEASIVAYSKLGMKVNITELDIDVLPTAMGRQTAEVSTNIASDPKLNPYVDGLPDEVQQKLAERYASLFKLYLRHRESISRITFWGVTDGDSWLNGWPVRGRTSYPLLFDRKGAPKPAFHAVIRTAAP